jgi:succinoglycan biosynthesis protein ExoM
MLGVREQFRGPGAARHISVCICTFRRFELLNRLLERLVKQRTEGLFKLSIVVTDNDAQQSSRPIVHSFVDRFGIDVIYTFEPRQNIALARNEALRHATGQFVAFIDDDEYPEDDWLLALLQVCERYEVSGVLGPVRPHFEEPPPEWIVKGRFCERPEYASGRIMSWQESRTGNLLVRKCILDGMNEPFRPEFGTGGEDVDFFLRMMQRGCEFRWCNEGVVYETVPKERWKRTYMLKRALLRGSNTLKLPVNRAKYVVKSFIAVPLYLALLPVALVLGQHVFMNYCIKFCDHAGRLLALARLNPIRER